MRDPLLSLINPYFQTGCVYDYFYTLFIDNKCILDHLYEMYQQMPIDKFMQASYKFCQNHEADVYKRQVIVCSPVGAYYPEGVNPVKIYVEEEYVRAVRGGTGFTKCGGNYAGSVAAQAKAEKLGYTQVLWLDGVERKYVEEVGTMNVMFKINNEIYTAPVSYTHLDVYKRQCTSSSRPLAAN